MTIPKELERIHLSQQAKNSLVILKRRTGIKNWNVLCRWAFCLSLAEPKPPQQAKILTDSNVEISWSTFASDFSNIFLLLLKERCLTDHLLVNEDNLTYQFNLHLHRGIAYLATKGKISNIQDLVSLVGK